MSWNKLRKYYVYTYLDNNKPYYIGMGSNSRVVDIRRVRTGTTLSPKIKDKISKSCSKALYEYWRKVKAGEIVRGVV